jgi:hypothetical protein
MVMKLINGLNNLKRNKMERYLYGALFGMIAEYCYRVHCGVIQLFLLFTLIVIFIIDIFQQFKKK